MQLRIDVCRLMKNIQIGRNNLSKLDEQDFYREKTSDFPDHPTDENMNFSVNYQQEAQQHTKHLSYGNFKLNQSING